MTTKPKQVNHSRECYKLYQKEGQKAVFDYAKKHNLKLANCKPCEIESPIEENICLVCGTAIEPKQAHTPTPWEVKFFTPHAITKDGEDIAITIGDNPKSTANAAFIVRACNSHEELLKALIKCRIALTPHVFIDDDARKARNMADEAIAKAEAK